MRYAMLDVGNAPAGIAPYQQRLSSSVALPSCTMRLPDRSSGSASPRFSIWVLRHDLHGVGAVGLVDAHRRGRADAVTVKEDHDLANDLLLGPGSGNTASSSRTNAGHFPQALWFHFNRIEHLLAKSAHELFGVDRADGRGSSPIPSYFSMPSSEELAPRQLDRNRALNLAAATFAIDPTSAEALIDHNPRRRASEHEIVSGKRMPSEKTDL